MQRIKSMQRDASCICAVSVFSMLAVGGILSPHPKMWDFQPGPLNVDVAAPSARPPLEASIGAPPMDIFAARADPSESQGSAVRLQSRQKRCQDDNVVCSGQMW